MEKIIDYLTFIPWILFYTKIILSGMKSTKNAKSPLLWFKENKSKLIHFENILIIAIYVYFSLQKNDTVLKMLFVVINFYFFINAFYDTREERKNKLNSADISSILLTIIFTLPPFTYFLKTNNLRITYYILIGYSFFNYIIVFMSRMINNFLNSLFKKIEK